jgi:hypothetical protein
MKPVVFKAGTTLIKAAKLKARKDGRTLSAYIRQLVERDVRGEAA